MTKRCNVSEIGQEMIAALGVLRDHIKDSDETVKDAFASIETHVAVTLRVLAKTNPSKIKDAARTVEISVLLRDAEKKGML